MIALALAASLQWIVQDDYVEYRHQDFTVVVGEIYDAACAGQSHCPKSPKVEISLFSEFPGEAHTQFNRHRDSYDGIGKMGNSYTVTYKDGVMRIQSTDVAWFYLQNRVNFRNPDDQEVWTIDMSGFKQAYNQMLINRRK